MKKRGSVTVVGFYTDDNLYSQHSQLLKKSLSRFGIELISEKVSKDGWQKIIAYKPRFILEMREKYRGKLLYIDADAFVHNDFQPFFESISEDIGVHYLQNRELISGTLFLNDTDNTLALLREWVVRMEKDPDIWDQKVLQEVIEEFLTDEKISLKKLAPEYNYIIDFTKEREDGVGEPIIEHLQASREMRYREKNRKLLRRIFGIKKRPNEKFLNRRKRLRELAKEVDMEFHFE
jgi:hypothetical protein